MLFRLTIIVVLAFANVAVNVDAKESSNVWTSPDVAREQNSDFAVQGEYVGRIDVDGGMQVGCQIIALGKGRFAAKPFFGGLPGDGWNGEIMGTTEAAMRDDGQIMFEGGQASGVWKDGVLTINVDGNDVGTLKRVERKSKTLGQEPPKNAIVLFDGKNVDQWNSAVKEGDVLAFDPKGKGATSKQTFGSHTLHIEFRLPFMPEARGQQRGNSGIYSQGRYEVQMLDSFGLAGEDNECGGIYSISKPKLNMCYPPLTWQTYDIEFTAAKYDSAGDVVANPRITVRHNDVLIHKDLELPHYTTAAINKPGPDDGPVYLQNHNNPVRYRNIWVVKKTAAATGPSE